MESAEAIWTMFLCRKVGFQVDNIVNNNSSHAVSYQSYFYCFMPCQFFQEIDIKLLNLTHARDGVRYIVLDIF